MKEIEKIKFPIKKEMELFEAKFLKSMNSNVPLLNRITHYVVNRKGKQMRPMFVFLTAKMITNGVINEKVYRAASVIELIHTATLVHDDVVDSSYMRRGFFSLNALWKNKIAVLVGDFLLSKGMLLCIDNDDFDLLKLISKSVKDMSQGELLQIEKARRLDIDEETYFEIVRKKTASLISSCCALGASASGVSKDKIDQFSNFGEKIGEKKFIKKSIKHNLFYAKKLKNFLENYRIFSNVITANFLLLDFEKSKYSANFFYQRLKSKGIILRSTKDGYLIKNKLRLTIGSSKENLKFISIVKGMFK